MNRIIPSQVDWLSTFMHKAGSGACICEGQEIWAAVNEIESLRQQLAEAQIPDGWQLTRIEPDADMLKAAQTKSEIGAYIAANWANAYDCFAEFHKAMLSAAPKNNLHLGWINVEDRLPENGRGISSFMTGPVLVKGTWREDYPIVAHFILETTNDSFCNAEIKFKHKDKYNFYSVRCPFIDVDNLGPKFKNRIPAAFTYAVTHWMPLPAAPMRKEAE